MVTASALGRVCFLMQVRPERVREYMAVHEDVWPDMLAALKDAGWHNYSLFVREDDGLVVGYLETDDFDGARARMAAQGVNQRWQDTMAQYFAEPRGTDRSMLPLIEYFHLD